MVGLNGLPCRGTLDALGHHYSVQVLLRYREIGHRKPDYVFVASEQEKCALTNKIYKPDEISHALAVGHAKIWGSNLDQSAPGQRNPSQQTDEYLRYGELSWGILTDGRMWRLYQRDSSKYNTYYAVNLDNLLQCDVEGFLYFYAFFRREAFISGWLEKLLVGSEDFAQKLTDTLEDEVYEALELIAQGFLDYRRNRLTAEPAMLRTIFDLATGSGHFVVDVTAYIAKWLRELGLRPTDLGDEDELVYW